MRAGRGFIAYLSFSLFSANKALLLSNLGRLMRLCAQAVGGVESKLTGRRGEFSQEERGYFNKVVVVFNVISINLKNVNDFGHLFCSKALVFTRKNIVLELL